MVADSKWLVFPMAPRASSSFLSKIRVSPTSLLHRERAPYGVACEALVPGHTALEKCASYWFLSARHLKICTSIPSFLSLFNGSFLLRQWELAIMSRDSPQSISPERRSRDTESHAYSDANIRNFAPVARIMKTALPENAKIAKEAKECMQECVSEFISFITSEGMLFPGPNAVSFSPQSNRGLANAFRFAPVP